MVAGECGLGQDQGRSGLEARQQQRGLDLGRGHIRIVPTSSEGAATAHRERCQRAVPAPVEACPEAPQGLGDAVHGATTQRRVTGQHDVHGLARQQSAEQPHRGAGVPTVQHDARFGEHAAEAVEHQAVPVHLGACFDAQAQCLHTCQAVAHVRAVQKAPNTCPPGTQAGEDECPVRDRLVTGHRHRPLQGRTGRAHRAWAGALRGGRLSLFRHVPRVDRRWGARCPWRPWMPRRAPAPRPPGCGSADSGPRGVRRATRSRVPRGAREGRCPAWPRRPRGPGAHPRGARSPPGPPHRAPGSRLP